MRGLGAVSTAAGETWEVVGAGLYALLKRALDVAVAALGLLLASPLLLTLAVLIRLDSPGPALYRQWRVGRGGRLFRMFKFRTMRQGAEGDLARLLQGDPRARLTWEQWQKLVHDPRLTRLGRWLRRTSLDELPQLWNVLKGDMSLVGPRPILPSQRALYGPAMAGYIQMRPGVTGLWQVSGRNRLSFDERVALDQRYLAERGLRMDLWILLRTVVVVLRGEGAF